MKVELEPGDKLTVTLKHSDGLFTITWGETSLTVESDLPDQKGREGVIYEEVWGPGSSDDVTDVPELRVLSEDQHQTLYGILGMHAVISPSVIKSMSTTVDLELDSLDLVDIVMSVEDEFDVVFPKDFTWSTVSVLEDKLAELLQNATR